MKIILVKMKTANLFIITFSCIFSFFQGLIFDIHIFTYICHNFLNTHEMRSSWDGMVRRNIKKRSAILTERRIVVLVEEAMVIVFAKITLCSSAGLLIYRPPSGAAGSAHGPDYHTSSIQPRHNIHPITDLPLKPNWNRRILLLSKIDKCG